MQLPRLIIRCRRSIILLAVAAAAFALVGRASAATPSIGSFTSTVSVIDPGASAACGFPVTDTETDTVHFEVFFDNTGTPVRAQVEENFTGVFTANGLAVNIAGASLSIFNVNGGMTDAGINIRVSLPGGGILYIDRGRLVFDNNGNLVFEAGSHPSLHGDFPGLCAALTP
jgi:hypothetical protein